MAQMPPLKALALQLLERGPLRRSDDGWQSDHHRQVFNSHTVDWLVTWGHAEFSQDRTAVYQSEVAAA